MGAQTAAERADPTRRDTPKSAPRPCNCGTYRSYLTPRCEVVADPCARRQLRLPGSSGHSGATSTFRLVQVGQRISPCSFLSDVASGITIIGACQTCPQCRHDAPTESPPRARMSPTVTSPQSPGFPLILDHRAQGGCRTQPQLPAPDREIRPWLANPGPD